MEVLIIEDDRRMAALLERGLRGEGHQVFVASDGVEGFDFAQLRVYDVIVLDVLLPGMSGFQVVERLRRKGNKTPVLMLTSKDAPSDAVQGLDAGADDYLTKPFAFEELLARLRAVARRGPVTHPPVLKIGDLQINPAAHTVNRGGETIALTPREYQILELMMRRAGRVLTRDALLEVVWGSETDVEFNTVDAFVSSLRRKLDGPDRPRLIHTVRGVGFCLKEPEP